MHAGPYVRHAIAPVRCPRAAVDRDVLDEIEAGRISIEPWEPEMMQPSSIDVRLDRFFRVFENHRYPHIDPAADQSDLTRLIEPEGEEPFILHPGEFVLGSTYEVVTLPGDVAARSRASPLWDGWDCSPTRPPASSTPASPGT